jgi:acetyltransferase-like isoleucine patch superfamily enzyme
MTNTHLFAHRGVGVFIHDPHLSVFLKPEAISVFDHVRIDAFVKIEGGWGLSIGAGSHVSSFAHLNVGGGRLAIGQNVALTSGVKIHTGSNTPAGRSMSSAAPAEMQVVERGECIIGDYAFIGSGAQVLMGANVGSYAIVGAGAVVTKSVPAYTVVMGVPAKVVGRRVELANGKWGVEYFAKGEQLAELMEEQYSR